MVRDDLVIDARFVSVILSGMASRGFDTDVVLWRAHLDPAMLKTPGARITQQQLAGLIAVMTRLSGDEFWGLFARPIKLGTFRMLCRVLIQSRNLQAAIIDGVRFYRLLIDDVVLRLSVDETYATIWLDDRTGMRPSRAAVHGPVIFFVFGLMCWLVGRRIPLIGVQHAFRVGPHSTALRPYYQAPLAFDCPRTEIRFDKAFLFLPIVPDEQRLTRFLSSVPSALLVRFRDDESFAERVKSLLRRNMTRDMSVEETADILMTTPQTLRRRLIEEGAEGFRRIKEHVRAAEALRRLTATDSPLETIAFDLGFSEVSAFHRAFRRWTGRTPGEVRQGR